MIPMSELVKDPTYKRFLQTKPSTPTISRNKSMMISPPWVVYVQRELGGKWGKREFWKYSEAFKFLAKALKANVHDAALNNKRVPCGPPMRVVRIKGKYQEDSHGELRQVTKAIPWKLRMEPGDADHEWCGYCRRPTEFKYYRRHKRLAAIDPTVRRCCICGASERIALVAGRKI